ncbi:tetratricopeptide repeat protein [Streptomyces sp. NPDC048417]|uniref:tetratricopeptide repeat protein n=1 Tax=Streptomyces sp. NPDC048417 TaxID=3155387 RepID=UPI0034485FE9
MDTGVDELARAGARTVVQGLAVLKEGPRPPSMADFPFLLCLLDAPGGSRIEGRLVVDWHRLRNRGSAATREIETDWFHRLRSRLSTDPLRAAQLRAALEEDRRRPDADTDVPEGTGAADSEEPADPAASPAPDSPQSAGDHVDFRNATFQDQVVGVQHHHYGSMPVSIAWRPADEVAPLEFGVRPTRRVPGLPEVPPYIPRDCDKRLRAELDHPGLVLILGEPYVGKSYSAWHGVQSLADPVLHIPEPGEDLRALLTEPEGGHGRSVVWLDDLTDHLGDGRLGPRLLGRLTTLGVVVIGTMPTDEYYRRRAGTEPGDRVVAMARTVEVPREWSEGELQRLAGHRRDPRAYPAFLWSGREGAASYFAIGHLLFDEWRRIGTQLEHPGGQLLVRAAVDLARCGVTAAVPVALLRAVRRRYAAEEREPFEEAFAWATAPLFGVSGLLVEGDEKGTWRAYGALVAEALRSGDLEPVPDEVWWTLLDAAEADTPFDRGAVVDAARAALQPRFEAGDTVAMYAFAGRIDGEESAELLRRAAEAGHPEAAEQLAVRLLAVGDEEAALRYLEAAAEGGSVSAAREAGRLHRDRAERWLRRAAEAGDGAAAHQLGEMLMGRGHRPEARHWYFRALSKGHQEVAFGLANLCLGAGDLVTAESWLRRGVDQGDARAMNGLALLLHRMDRDDPEWEELFRRSAAAGYVGARVNLGSRLMAQGQEQEAERLFHEADALGNSEAAFQIAGLLVRRGAEEEALQWYRRAAERGHYLAEGVLADRAVPPPHAPDTVKE